MEKLAFKKRKSRAGSAPEAGAVAPLDYLRREEADFQESVSHFAEETLSPWVLKCDRDAYLPPEVMARFFAEGLMGIEVPTAYGGRGHPLFYTILAIEALSRIDPSMAVFVHVHNLLTNSLLLKFGSEEQKEVYLPRLTAGCVGAFAVTEPAAGSDLSNAQTEAVKTDHGYLINGRKRWITNAREAGLFTVLAKTRSNTSSVDVQSAFVVEANAPGVTVSPPIEKMGVRASSTCEVTFENVEVPDLALVGKIGAGRDVGTYGITLGRVGIAAQMTGLAHGALERAVKYACDREQFGVPISTFQGVSFPIAKAAAELHAARLMTYNIARKAEAGIPFIRLIEEASEAKLFTSHVADAAACVALETHGGNGYDRSFIVEKFYRDAKVGKIYEGTTNILLRTIANSLMPRSSG